MIELEELAKLNEWTDLLQTLSKVQRGTYR